MQPIQHLLHRIRWDKAFSQGTFEIGYYDRVEDRLVWVAFRQVSFPAEARRAFELVGEDGQIMRIPLHRVREVRKDGKLIWQRSLTRGGGSCFRRPTPPSP